jgi:L-prolyl-PCP dehydrogenase
MDFSWSEQQRELYDGALAFARSLGSSPARSGHALGFDRDLWERCAEFGLTGLSVPIAGGGVGLDAVTTARVVEAFGRGMRDSGLLFSVSAHLFAVTMPVVEYADWELQRDVVPDLAAGRRIGANAISEPGAGSDTSRLATVAVRKGDEYVLSGDKSYVTNGPVADEYLVYATTNPRAGYLGQSAFLVSSATPGLEVSAAYPKTGLTGSALGALRLNECRVPALRRLGREGQAAQIFARSMAWERACLFAAFVGAMEDSLERCVEYACGRAQHGRPIVSHQAVSHRMAEMKRRLEAARLLLYRACWTHDQGQDATLEIALAKLAISEAAVESGLDAIRIHGGLGYMKESGIDRYLLDAVGSTIFSGTSDIQRELIVRDLVKRSGAVAATVQAAARRSGALRAVPDEGVAAAHAHA